MDARKDKAAKRSSKRKRTTNDKLIKLRTNTVDELRNYLRVVDFENPKQLEVFETKSTISTFSVVESSEGDYLIFHREYGSFRVFNLLWDILHVIYREDLYHLYQQVQAYFEHILSTGVGLVLLGDLTTI
jgi:hypothetical protein